VRPPRKAGEDRHHLPAIVVGEYRYGLLRSRRRRDPELLLTTLTRESILPPVDEITAEAYAGVRDDLRRRGRPIPENDVWIAASARLHHLPVVSRDDHFDFVPGLHRIAL
jgi:predicted nucleic acid-binding protein